MTDASRLDTLLAAAEEEFDPYAERILEAARREFLEHGLRRTSLDDIARAADVSRATLFRRFADRDTLVRALAAREAQGLIAVVDAKAAGIEDPEERIVAGFLAAMSEIPRHDLLQRLLVTDRDAVMPLLTQRGSAVLAVGRAYLAAQVRRARDDGLPVAGDPDQIGEICARIALSLALNPDTVLPLDDDAGLERFARTVIVPLIVGREGAR